VHVSSLPLTPPPQERSIGAADPVVGDIQAAFGNGLRARRSARSYSMLIFSSLSKLAVMDSSTGLLPLIQVPPSRRRSAGNAP